MTDPLPFMESPILLVLVLVLVLIAIALAAWWIQASLKKALRPPDENTALTLLQNQVSTLSQQLTQSISDTRASMDARLDGAARVIQGVNQQLGQLGESTRRMVELGKDISSLQDILRAPKLRGNLGELFLGDLLSQILPSDHYRLQHSFSTGVTVDAVIQLKAGLVPVDAKFPLENFKLIVNASTDEVRKVARRNFIRDVRKHIDDIASKYIRPDEDTFDFALMYVPAENVYYETIIKDDEFGGEMSIFNYALKKRVIPVSPNSFYAYLQTILLGLKGMRIEDGARDMLNQLASLGKEFERFEEAFRLIGQHIANAQTKFQEAEKRLGRVQGKMEQIDGMVKGLEAAPQPAGRVEAGIAPD